MKLSKNLTYKEAITSKTAENLGISNDMTKEHLINAVYLAIKVFQPIRDHFKKPIRVHSLYRGHEVNTAINGAKGSQHLKGEAIDIDVDMYDYDFNNYDVFKWVINNLDFDQIIYEFGDGVQNNWTHISYTRHRTNRKRITMAHKVSGKTHYTHFED